LLLGTPFLSATHSKTSDIVLLFFSISEVYTNFGIVSAIQMLAESAALHPDELVYSLLSTGFTALCYDGKPFFATDHAVGEKAVSNSRCDLQGMYQPSVLVYSTPICAL